MPENEATQTKEVSNAANAETQKPLDIKAKVAGVEPEKVVGEKDIIAGRKHRRKERTRKMKLKTFCREKPTRELPKHRKPCKRKSMPSKRKSKCRS